MKQSRRVYLLPRHESASRKALVQFLEAADLKAVPWPGADYILGSARPLDQTLLHEAFFGAQAIIVVLTGEDVGKPNPSLPAPSDSRYARSWLPQPKPDTLIEAGIALGAAPDRTILLRIGRQRPLDRVWSREMLSLDNSIRSRKLLLDRLTEMGCAVDTASGHWTDAGDLEVAKGQPLPDEFEPNRTELAKDDRDLAHLPSSNGAFLRRLEALLQASIAGSIAPDWIAKELGMEAAEVEDHLMKLMALGYVTEYKQIGRSKYGLSKEYKFLK